MKKLRNIIIVILVISLLVCIGYFVIYKNLMSTSDFPEYSKKVESILKGSYDNDFKDILVSENIFYTGNDLILVQENIDLFLKYEKEIKDFYEENKGLDEMQKWDILCDSDILGDLRSLMNERDTEYSADEIERLTVSEIFIDYVDAGDNGEFEIIDGDLYVKPESLSFENGVATAAYKGLEYTITAYTNGKVVYKALKDWETWKSLSLINELNYGDSIEQRYQDESEIFNIIVLYNLDKKGNVESISIDWAE